MPVVSSTSFVPDLFTENAGPGTLAMDAACNDRDWIPARTGLSRRRHVRRLGGRSAANGRKPAGTSVGEGLPDQLGHIDDQIGTGLTGIAGCANLAGADADRVVQPTVGLAVGQVKH